MKKYLLIGLTALALYACSDSSQNVVPVSQTKPNNHRSSETNCPTVDTAEIVSLITDAEISDEYKEIYNKFPEIVAIIKTNKSEELMGLAGVEPEELIGHSIELYEQNCTNGQYANGRVGIKVIPIQERSIRELFARICC